MAPTKVEFRTITENPGKIELSSATYTVAEDGSSIDIAIKRFDGMQGAVSVNYTITGTTATADDDYTATNGSLNWADDELCSKTFTINIINDILPEIGETITISLNSPTGGAAFTSAEVGGAASFARTT